MKIETLLSRTLSSMPVERPGLALDSALFQDCLSMPHMHGMRRGRINPAGDDLRPYSQLVYHVRSSTRPAATRLGAWRMGQDCRYENEVGTKFEPPRAVSDTVQRLQT